MALVSVLELDAVARKHPGCRIVVRFYQGAYQRNVIHTVGRSPKGTYAVDGLDCDMIEATNALRKWKKLASTIVAREAV